MKRYAHLEELQTAYAVSCKAIVQRHRDYAAVPPEQYFYELCYCLMTPQSSAVNAMQVQVKLEAAQFLHAEVDLVALLSDRAHYIRFHRNKSRWLRMMKEQYHHIHTVICSPLPAEEKRECLTDNVKGLSYKESTHFLRNIGKNEELAILDRHILKNLRYHGVLSRIPETLTLKRYRLIEKKFQRFAEEIGISLNELDLLFWSRETGSILK